MLQNTAQNLRIRLNILNLLLHQNYWCTSGNWRNWESPFLEDPVNLSVITELTAGGFRLIS